MSLDFQAWNQLWSQFSKKDSLHWFKELDRLYSEPHRHYHNAQHIRDCLQEFSSSHETATWPTELQLAIWLHDAIYDPRGSDNEEESKGLAVKLMNDAGVDELFAQRVGSLILATKHQAIPTDHDEQLLVDIDLAILGQPPERFWKYEQQIREEYAFVPEEVFRSKRAEILEGFLARPFLYHTKYFKERYEERARLNLASSISMRRA